MNRGKRGNVPECGDIVLTTSRGIVAVTARTANCRIAVRPSLLLLSKRPLRSSSIAKGRFFQGELTKLNWLKARRREHSHTGNYLHAHDCNVTPMAASILGSDGPTSFGAGARPCATVRGRYGFFQLSVRSRPDGSAAAVDRRRYGAWSPRLAQVGRRRAGQCDPHERPDQTFASASASGFT